MGQVADQGEAGDGSSADQNAIQFRRFPSGADLLPAFNVGARFSDRNPRSRAHLFGMMVSDEFDTNRRQAQNIYYSTDHSGVCVMLKTLKLLRFAAKALECLV